jgi:hypothetical protein
LPPTEEEDEEERERGRGEEGRKKEKEINLTAVFLCLDHASGYLIPHQSNSATVGPVWASSLLLIPRTVLVGLWASSLYLYGGDARENASRWRRFSGRVWRGSRC